MLVQRKSGSRRTANLNSNLAPPSPRTAIARMVQEQGCFTMIRLDIEHSAWKKSRRSKVEVYRQGMGDEAADAGAENVGHSTSIG